MRKLLKSIACFAAATLVGTVALADGLNAGNTLTIGGNTTDWSLWSQSGDSPTDLGYLSDLTVADAKVFWWADFFNNGANMYFTLWDGGDQPVGAWQDVWLGNSTYVGGEYGHDYTVDGPDGGAKDLNSTWGVFLEEGKTYYLDVKVKTYKNGDSGGSWYPSSDGNAYYHAKFTYCTTLQKFVYNLNGGTSCDVMELQLPIGSTYERAKQAVWAGHVFLGWWTEPTGGTRYQNGKSTVPDNGGEPIQLYAHWAGEKVVTLNAMGGECSKTSITRPVGNVYWGLPSAPTKDGCKFLGWFTAETGGTRVRNGDTVNADDPTTLYAQWKERVAPLAFTGFSISSKIARATPRAGTATLPIEEKYTSTKNWTTLTGFSGSGVGTYANGSCKFSGAGQYLTVQFDAAPGTVTFALYGNSSSGGTSPGSFLVEESANGDDWTEVVDVPCTSITSSSADFGPYNLKSASRYVRWTYATKYQWNLGLNNVRITAGSASEPTVTVDPTEAKVAVNETVDIYATAEGFSGDVVWSWEGEGDSEDDYFLFAASEAGTYTVTATATYGSESDSASATITVCTPHAINVTVGDHGVRAEADAESAIVGTPVLITWEAADGYTLDAITVNNGTVAVTDDDTFEMPDAIANVNVTFKEKPAGYEKITSLDDLVPGEYVITGVKAAGEEYAMKAEVSTSSTKYILRRTKAVTIEDDAVTDADDDIIWTLAQTDDGWTIYNSAVGYVYWSSGNSANAQQTTSDNSYWTISLNSDGDGTFAVKNAATPARNLRYNTNSGQERFAAYQASSSGLTGSGLNFYKAPSSVPMQTFNYNLNGGDSCAVMTLTLPVGATYEGAVQAVWAGHVFRGWWTETTGGTRYQNGKSEVPDNGGEPIELYAHWSAAQVVQFNAGEGATCDPASVTLSQGETYWHFPTPTKDGYKFLGWFTAEEGGSRVKNGDSPVTYEASRELFAHWQALKVVTLNAMGGTCSQESITRPVGDVYWGLPSAPTKQDCKFLGWYTAETGGTRVRNGDTVNADDPTTLYAQWKQRASALAITGFSVAPRTAAPAARSAAGDTVECTLWVNTIATVDYEIYWTDDLTGEWTVLKRWTATDDGETSVTVAIPAGSTTGFFRIVELGVE